MCTIWYHLSRAILYVCTCDGGLCCVMWSSVWVGCGACKGICVMSLDALCHWWCFGAVRVRVTLVGLRVGVGIWLGSKVTLRG